MTSSESTTPAKATRREWLGLAVLGLAALMYVMDLTVLHLAVPKMSADGAREHARRAPAAGDRVGGHLCGACPGLG